MKRDTIFLVLICVGMFFFASFALWPEEIQQATVGVTYHGIHENETALPTEMTDISSRNFKLVRVPVCFQWNSDPDAMHLNCSERFLSEARKHGLKTFVVCNVPLGQLEFDVVQTWKFVFREYVSKFADKVDYWQIFNELDCMKKADGNYYMATELVQCFNVLATEIRNGDPTGKIVGVFSQIYMARIDLLNEIGKLDLDYAGLNVYEQGQQFSTMQIDHLKAATGKPVIITELGTSEQDPQKKADWLTGQVAFFKSRVPMVVLFDWKDSLYAIKPTDYSVSS